MQQQIAAKRCGSFGLHRAPSGTAAHSSTSRQQSVSRRLQCHASVVWRQLDRTKTWLAHPRSARTKGVIHFLGGAFAGAAPQLFYNSFVELLADAGYTVISTPYQVTFQHDVCARQVRQAFLDSLSELSATGRSYLAPPRVPQFGVGHSNGALLHLLINSYEPGATDANVIISYNNLQVSDAIPIPGFLDSLQPTVQAARAANLSSSSSSSTSSSDAADAQQQLLAVAAAALPLAQQQQQLLAGAAPALEQLSSVVNEVGDGLTDFSPSPEESRAIIKAGYACSATLLLQFQDDNFDETPEMQKILQERQASSTLDSAQTTAPESDSSPTAGEAAPAAEPSSSSARSGYTSAWNSIDEDVSLDTLLQQLQDLQASVQQNEQQWLEQQPTQINSKVPFVQQLLLPGTHVTPCGAQLQGTFDAFVPGNSSSGNSDELRQLARNVTGFLDSNRPAAGQRRALLLQQRQQQQQQGQVQDAAAGAGVLQGTLVSASVAEGVRTSQGATA